MGREDKILVVEDNPVICREMEAKFNCDCATDGWDASGYGVLTYLREENGEELANVIFMTSSDRDSVQRRIGGGLHVIDKADAVDEITRMLLD